MLNNKIIKNKKYQWIKLGKKYNKKNPKLNKQQ